MAPRRLTTALVVAQILVAACVGDSDGCSTETVTSESGLRYRDEVCGDGEDATARSAVTVEYIGELENGEVFDSSAERGGPQTFPLDQVVRGFQEGVAGMSEGGVRVLTIPPDLGYGSAGLPPKVPPNATLIFEVELIEVETSG